MARGVEDLIDRRRMGTPSGRPKPQWSERSVWLIAYPDHVPVRGQTPLQALRQFIDDHLGDVVDGVHILPFAPWSSDGGFAVIDYEAVDPRYGMWVDIESIADERPVMFDAVINHLSASSDWFTRFLAGDPEYDGFFRTSDPSIDTSRVVRPRTHPLLTPFERTDPATGKVGTVHVWTTFSPDQVDLDYANPAVLLRVLEVLAGYCEHGASAIRLDAIGFLWKDEATESIHLPQTHQLIQLMRSFLDEIAPGTILISETNVPHAENVSYLGDPGVDEVHAVYQFPLAPLVAHAALTGDTSVLTSWAADIDTVVGPGRSFLNFLACHDGVGLRPAEGLLGADQLQVLLDACLRAGGMISERSLPDGSSSPYELNTTWFDLMGDGLHGPDGADIAVGRHLATHAVMLALPGIAAIYVQSLVGASNDLDAVARTGHARDVNRMRFDDRDTLVSELTTEASRGHRISVGLARLVSARRSSRAFHPEGGLRVLEAPRGVFAVEREHDGHRARVVVNLTTDACDVGSIVKGWVPLLPDDASDPPPPQIPPLTSLWLRAPGS